MKQRPESRLELDFALTPEVHLSPHHSEYTGLGGDGRRMLTTHSHFYRLDPECPLKAHVVRKAWGYWAVVETKRRSPPGAHRTLGVMPLKDTEDPNSFFHSPGCHEIISFLPAVSTCHDQHHVPTATGPTNYS